MPLRNWPQVYNEFAVVYGDRMLVNEDRAISTADIKRGTVAERLPAGGLSALHTKNLTKPRYVISSYRGENRCLTF